MARLSPFLLIALAGAFGLLSLSVPLEKHEVLVLATAQSMLDRQDWILPVYNGQPRLNKPPLNYWLTAGLAQLDPWHDRVQIFHGRLISLWASWLTAWLLFKLALSQYGQNVALSASLALLGMIGWQLYAHNARPDMLYAALSFAHLYAWFKLEQTGRSTWAYLGWIAFGLATLSKGPQAPLVLGLIWLILHRHWRAYRIGSGLIIYSLLVLPWWILLNMRLQSMHIELQSHQLSGALLLHLASWSELLSLYYIKHSIGLALPISLGFLLIRRPVQIDKYVFLIIGFILIFSLGGHYRKHYLLPILPWLSLMIIQLKPRLIKPNWIWAVLWFWFGLNMVYAAQNEPIYWLFFPWFLPWLPKKKKIAWLILIFNINFSHAVLPLDPKGAEAERFAKQVAERINGPALLWQAKLSILPYFIETRSVKSPPKSGYLILPQIKLSQIQTPYRILLLSGPTDKHKQGLALIDLNRTHP